MINVTLKSQLLSTTAKINDIAYCTENNTFYRLSSTNESITLNNTDFIVSNGTNYWIAFGGKNSKSPSSVLNDTLDDNVDVLTSSIIEKEPTGFRHPNDVIVTYDSTSRTVTLTGDTECYLNGKRVSTLYNENGTVFSTSFDAGWVSPIHADTSATNFFCYICWENEKAVVKFDTSIWDFNCIQICFVQYKISADGGTKSIGIHETHGLNMNHMTHSHLHKTIGTFRESGGGIGGVTFTPTISYTATDRRPTVEQTVLIDEDVKTTLPIHNTKNNYTLRRLSGSSQNSPTKDFITNATDIVQLSGNIPLINTWNGTAWVSTTKMTSNQYACLFLVAVPVSSDTESQKFRYMWVQPQTASTTLTTIQAITPNNLVHGDSTFFLTEYCFIGKVIIRYVGGGSNNWHIYSTELITGNRSSQVSISGGGGYLTTISLDSSDFDGDGINTPIALKNFNDTKQYANVDGAWTEIVSSGGSSEVAPVITTTNLMLDATTHSHIFNNNTTDLIHILPLASENTGKRFLLKNKNTGLTYLKTAQVKITGDTSWGINGLYAENGYLNGRMRYVSNYSNSRWNRVESDGVIYWGVYDTAYNTRQYVTPFGVTVFPYEATWNGITVTQVTDTIDGLTTIVLPVKGSYIEVESDGVTWNVIRESY